MRDRTSKEQRATADTQAYAHVGITLLVGLLASIAVMAIGLAASAVRGTSGTSVVLSLEDIVPQLLKGDPPAILDAGILLLFAAPLGGVLVALGEFLAQGDGPFTLISALLLMMLVVAFGIALH